MFKKLIYIKNEPYILNRMVKEHNNPEIDVWKEHTYSDKVFIKEGIYYFCNIIPEAQIIEN